MRPARSIIILSAGVAVFAVWMSWWASAGFPLEGQICDAANGGLDCARHNLILYAILLFAQTADHWSALIGLVAAGFIAWFGYILLRTNEKSLAVTGQAAAAAETAAASAFAAERARFFVAVEDHNLTWLTDLVENGNAALNDDDLIPGGNVRIKYRFRNYGKTPGIVRVLAVDAAIAGVPVEPVFKIAINDFPENMIGPQGWTKQKTYALPAQPNAAQIRALRNNTARLWFFGTLDYDDVFGKRQTHRFYFRSARTPDGECLLQPFDFDDHNQST